MTKTCALLLADGFETIEALAPLDALTRAGVAVTRVACGPKDGLGAVSSHGVPVACDAKVDDVDLSSFDLVVVPGGAGVDNLRECAPVMAELVRRMGAGELLGAICAAPRLLAEQHLLDGRTATCYPGCETDFPDGVRPDELGVYRDGDLVTASGPAFALPFGLALVALLLGDGARDQVASAMLFAE